MMTYWTNFARAGDPNGNGLSPWPRYDSEKKMIQLDSAITSGPDKHLPQYVFLVR
jgi:para-nitrobenzyl esterase